MNLEQATNLLAVSEKYISIKGKSATLDDNFTVEELKAIIWLLENKLTYNSLN